MPLTEWKSASPVTYSDKPQRLAVYATVSCQSNPQ